MSAGCFLPYVGLGSCLLHMPYIHQFAKKEGPVTILTFSKSLEDALKFDPNVKKIILVEKFHRKLSDIFKCESDPMEAQRKSYEFMMLFKLINS